MIRNLFYSVLAILVVVLFIMSNRIEGQLSYKEGNAETLALAQKTDLIVCVDAEAKTVFVFLIDKISGEIVSGDYVTQRTLTPATESISTFAERNCNIKIFRPSRARTAAEIILDVLLNGLNPTRPQ